MCIFFVFFIFLVYFCVGGSFTLATTFGGVFMSDLNIKNYLAKLSSVCLKCKKAAKCKHKDTICFRKQFVWEVAKYTYLKRKKEGLVQDE